MSFKRLNKILLLVFLITKFEIVISYPIFPTILTVSIPFNKENEYSEARVENNYLRLLQASGADLVVVHTWTKYEEIDYLLSKVNGILFQGNPDNLDTKSDYYNTIKYIYRKAIEMNDSGVKIPIISIGDDSALLCSIIAEDNLSIITKLKTEIF